MSLRSHIDKRCPTRLALSKGHTVGGPIRQLTGFSVMTFRRTLPRESIRPIRQQTPTRRPCSAKVDGIEAMFLGRLPVRRKRLRTTVRPLMSIASGWKCINLTGDYIWRRAGRVEKGSASRGDRYLDRQLLTSVNGWYSGGTIGSIIRKRSPSPETSYSKFGVRR
jgi:hypothetical protein